MHEELKLKLYTVTIDCTDPQALATFYGALLHWDVVFANEDFAVVGAPGTGQGGYPGLTFQRNPDYHPPVWPQQPGKQQQMAHLDFAVNDVPRAVARALSCGATVADAQFSGDWTVMLDPSGHPFCLCQMKAVMDGPEFALR